MSRTIGFHAVKNTVIILLYIPIVYRALGMIAARDRANISEDESKSRNQNLLPGPISSKLFVSDSCKIHNISFAASTRVVL
jgi:hypothetical protein